MDRKYYLQIMEFPEEWVEWGMFPDELWMELRQSYELGHEQSPEHDRNGAFHWWLRRSPSRCVLLKIFMLSLLDPDQIMAADVRRYISKSNNANESVRAVIAKVD